eukprot:3186456-Rhodomonas_salina.1
MFKHQLNSTLASDLPHLSTTSEPHWTVQDVCYNNDALNSSLSGDVTGSARPPPSPINISSPA